MNTSWKAGTARANITPTEPLWLAGYGGRDRPAEGTLQPVWAKALALEDAAGRRGVVVTTDLCGLSKASCDRVRDLIHRSAGLTAAEVLLTSTHNHCSPVTSDSLMDYYPLDGAAWEEVHRYTRRVEEQLAEIAATALSTCEPVTLHAGSGRADFAVNRRNNREADVPDLRAAGTPLAGPVDHRVPLLTARRKDGSLLALLFGYACHPTTLSFYQVCGDYPGYAQEALEAQHPGATALFWTGCGGDQNPLPRRTVELCRAYGARLAAGVDDALNGALRLLESEFQTAFATVPLPFDGMPGRTELLAAGETGNAIRRRWAARLLARLDRGEAFETEYPYPIQAWRLGHQLWLGLGAEAVVDYALRAQREFGPDTWTCGYAHELIAYIPSRRVWDEGGYEGGNLYEYGLPAERWSGDVEERIWAGIHDLAGRVERTSEA